MVTDIFSGNWQRFKNALLSIKSLFQHLWIHREKKCIIKCVNQQIVLWSHESITVKKCLHNIVIGNENMCSFCFFRNLHTFLSLQAFFCNVYCLLFSVEEIILSNCKFCHDVYILTDEKLFELIHCKTLLLTYFLLI